MWPMTTNGFGICYMLNVCVSCDLSQVVEIRIILSGMFRTLDKKKYKEKKNELLRIVYEIQIETHKEFLKFSKRLLYTNSSHVQKCCLYLEVTRLKYSFYISTHRLVCR